MTVIDASALAAYVLKEEGSEAVREHLKEGVTSVGLVAKETGNAILTALRRGRIDAAQAETSFKALCALLDHNITLIDQGGLLEDAFHTALEREGTVYDTIYVALAKGRGEALLSGDAKQMGIAKALGVRTARSTATG